MKNFKIGRMNARVKKIFQKNSKKTQLGCLFLDFDGVINIFLQENTKKYQKALEEPDSFDFCDRDCIEVLNHFCLTHEIEIVISSSWRFSGLEFCRKYLLEHGLHPHICIKDTTQMDWKTSREEEILQYVIDHPIYSYCIVLDDMDMPHMMHYFVQTNAYDGFNEEREAYANALIQRNFPWIQMYNLV